MLFILSLHKVQFWSGLARFSLDMWTIYTTSTSYNILFMHWNTFHLYICIIGIDANCNKETSAPTSTFSIVIAFGIKIEKAEWPVYARVILCIGKLYRGLQAYICASRTKSNHYLMVSFYNQSSETSSNFNCCSWVNAAWPNKLIK